MHVVKCSCHVHMHNNFFPHVDLINKLLVKSPLQVRFLIAISHACNCNPSSGRGVDVPEELRPLTDKELAKVSNAIEVFGMDQVSFKLLFTVQCMYMYTYNACTVYMHMYIYVTPWFSVHVTFCYMYMHCTFCVYMYIEQPL